MGGVRIFQLCKMKLEKASPNITLKLKALSVNENNIYILTRQYFLLQNLDYNCKRETVQVKVLSENTTTVHDKN